MVMIFQIPYILITASAFVNKFSLICYAINISPERAKIIIREVNSNDEVFIEGSGGRRICYQYI